MQKLNFPAYEFRLKKQANKVYIFDIIRKKFVVLTPEGMGATTCDSLFNR